MKRILRLLPRALTSVSALFLVFAACAERSEATPCTRYCLQHMMTVYVDAMLAHDPATLPTAADVRFTEDSHELKLGEGLWKTVTKKGGFRQDYVDQRSQIIASHMTLLEGSTQVLFSVVLRVNDRSLSGIETLVYRVPADAKSKPEHLDKPLPLMNNPVPAAKRMSRDAMIKTALRYEEGLKVGSFVQAGTPFAPEAYRYENGIKYAGEGCTTTSTCDIKTQKIMLHPDVKPSVAVVDEQAGIVVLWMNFGDTHSYGPGRALITFEAFKIYEGTIHAINAFLTYLPKETERGWPDNN